MGRHHSIPKHVLKNLEMFRAKQRKISNPNAEQVKKHQYRELEEILSPFWAWQR